MKLFKSKKQIGVLYAFYDLAVSPPTFDIVHFLILAEQARILSDLNSLQIVMVPGPNEGFRINDLESYQNTEIENYDIGYMKWRKNNILISCCTLLKSIKGVTTCNSREEAHAIESAVVNHVFPTGYTVDSPIQSYLLNLIINNKSFLPTFESGDEPKKIIKSWIELNTKGKKIVTISLRECHFDQERNSSLREWSNFARSLDNNYFIPVFIRDTEAVFGPLPSELKGLTIINEVCFNLELRAALYELSYINMFVNNGPASLCRYLKNSCTIVFKMITPEVGATTEQYFRLHGIEPGTQYPPLSSFHKVVWENDYYDVLKKEFEKMCTVITQA